MQQMAATAGTVAAAETIYGDFCLSVLEEVLHERAFTSPGNGKGRQLAGLACHVVNVPMGFLVPSEMPAEAGGKSTGAIGAACIEIGSGHKRV